jgi:hypothetical protein
MPFMNLDAQWIVGFTDGEGCFHIGIATQPELTLGVQVLPEFVVVQHKRDVQVLHAIKQFFGCGVVRTNHGDRMCYRVRKSDHLVQIIIPFFEKHHLKTRKQQDFLVFRDVLRLMSQRLHLTPQGLERIRVLTGRLSEVETESTNPSDVGSVEDSE